MAWMRRTRHLALTEPAGEPTGVVGIRSFLTGGLEELSLAELALLLGVSCRRWSWRVDAVARSLAKRGLLVSDEPCEPFTSLRDRDVELTALGWHPAAAAYQVATWWDGHRASGPGRDGSPPARGRRIGPPPPPFHDRGGERLPLERVERSDELHRLLRARRTARSFALPAVTSRELATLLHSVWGAHGTAPLALGDTAVRKTSPSGGALHPVEVYSIVHRVEGVAPGVYHYRVADHQLERLASLDGEQAAAMLERLTAGQWWFASADVAFVMTARFARSFWKYRLHAKALKVLYMDAGHLSQTFYLVCTLLGLGPFVTAAIDDGEIARTLDLDPLFEAPLALCGCGRAEEGRSRLDAKFRPLRAADHETAKR
jgi:putative peptide maturation dehydrogenase